MNKLLVTTVFLTVLLSGCQSIGDHLNCQAEVDRTVPPQTEQRYIRTDTKCSSFGLRSDQTNCSSTPIYQTIILNQAQRDTAMSQCSSRIITLRASENIQSRQDVILRSGDVMSMNDAKAICTKNGLNDGTAQHTSCVLRTVRGR